jgi:putative membrane protein
MESTTNRNRVLWIGLGVIALLALLSWSGGMWWAHPMVGPMVGYGIGHPFGFAPWLIGFGIIGGFMRLLIFGAILFFMVRLLRGRSMSARYDEFGRRDTAALEILNRRYASGEISREQYEEMRRTLER